MSKLYVLKSKLRYCKTGILTFEYVHHKLYILNLEVLCSNVFEACASSRHTTPVMAAQCTYSLRARFAGGAIIGLHTDCALPGLDAVPSPPAPSTTA